MNFLEIKETAGKLNKFCFPLILNSFFNMLFSSMLFSIIGRTSVETIASTEVVDGFFYTFIGILGVSTLSFNISISKTKENTEDFYDYFKSIFILNFFIGVIAIVVSLIYSKSILNKLYNFDGDILKVGTIYANIQSISILLNLIIFSMSNMLKVRKKTRAIFIVGIISSITQILLSYYILKVINIKFSVIGISIGSISALLIEVISYVIILKQDFYNTFRIKSTKKKELLKKSIPLVFQEILEGSIFQIIVIALISKLGYITLSSYAVSMRIVAISIVPMYAFCNAIVIFVGEFLRKKELYKLKILPIITIAETIAFYACISVLFYIFKMQFIKMFTDIDNVIIYTKQTIGFLLFFSLFQIFFEHTKYSLQSLGHSNMVLKITFLVNVISVFVLYIISLTPIFSLYCILAVISITYLILAVIFYMIYCVEIDRLF